MTIAFGCKADPKALKAKYVASGDRFVASGNVAAAIVEYRNAIQQDPLAGEVHAKLAEAYLRQGDGANGLKEYVRAADLLPNQNDVQIKAGGLLLLGGKFDDAKARAEKAVAHDPRDVDAQILLANALAGLKDFSAAVTEIEEAIKLDPQRSGTYANLGALELNRGQREPAEKAFRKAVELSPKSVPARLALANFFWVTSRWPEAEAELLGAVRVEPDNPLAHRALSYFYLATRRPDEAEPHLKRVLEITKTAAASLALADFYIARQQEPQARALLEPMVNTPASSLANVRLAALDYRAGHRDAAYKRIDEVLAKDAANEQGLLLKSALLLEDGKKDEALAAATLATEKHADSTAAHFAVGRVQAARHQIDAAIAAYQDAVRLNPRATDAKIALARLNLAAGRTDVSVNFAQEAVSNEPRNFDARIALVRSLIARGELARAQTELDSIQKGSKESATVHALTGFVLARQQKAAAARSEFERALALDASSTEALAGLVALDLGARKPNDARAKIDERLKSGKPSAELLMLAARVYAATGDVGATERTLRQVLEKDPDHLGAYSALGQVYLKQGRPDAALREFDAIAKRDPKPVAALTLTGMILEAQGNVDGARERFERVMQLNPQAAVAANNLAWLYAQHGGNLDVALQLAQTAKRKLPDTPEVDDTLGFVYFKKDLLALALPPLRASVEKDPVNPLYQYHLGLAYAKSGDTQRAKQHLSESLRLKSDFEGSQDARAVLDSLPAAR